MNNIIPSLRKALQLIRQLSEKNCTQAELSQKLHITMSTTYRILRTLLAEGWIVKKADSSYTLGGGMLLLLASFHRDVAQMEILRDIVAEIPAKTGLFAKLSIPCGNLHHVTLHYAAPEEEYMLFADKPGTVFPVSGDPAGIALLLDKTPGQLGDLCAASGGTPKPEALLQAVEKCKKKGYLLDCVGKSRWQVMEMALPLRFEGKIIASLAVLGCAEDFAGVRERRIFKVVKDFAAKCEKAVAGA